MMAAHSPPPPVCRSLRLLSSVTSAAILPAQPASISCLVCTTASELCPHFCLCSLDSPLHSTAIKHRCHILLFLTNFDFCSFKTKKKKKNLTFSVIWLLSLWPHFLPPSLPHCALATGLSHRSGVPRVLLGGRPMCLDSHPLLSLPPDRTQLSQSFCTTQSKLRKTEL